MQEFVKITVIASLGYLLTLSGKLTPYFYAPIKNAEWVKNNLALVHNTIGNIVWLGLCLLFTFVLLRYYFNSKESVLKVLGLRNNLLKGIAVGVAFTLPMIIGYASQVGFQDDITWQNLLIYSGYAGFFEELVYRAFFIGIMFRFTRLGFFPVVLLVSPIFGAAHLYQATSFMHGFSVFAITTLGSMFFAWLFVEYKWNLWVPITMHILMNACWSVFDLQATDAAGNALANTFRFFTIGFAVLVTLMKIYKQSSALKGQLIWGKV
jgi:uncharacterized protein